MRLEMLSVLTQASRGLPIRDYHAVFYTCMPATSATDARDSQAQGVALEARWETISTSSSKALVSISWPIVVSSSCCLLGTCRFKVVQPVVPIGAGVAAGA